MGILSFIRNQLIDVIEWLDDSNNTLVWRFPDNDHEIKNGAQLIVREGQAALFIYEGQLGDFFGPGRHILTTNNIPVLTTLKSWKYGFNSPFKCEVYFVNTRRYMDLKWGTMNPITLRDPDFGMVRVRAFGVYAIQVVAPQLFMREVVGTDGHFTTQEIEGQLKRMLVSTFTATVGAAKIAALDLAGNLEQIAATCKGKMEPQFREVGLSLARFDIENVSMPPEVEKAIDQRTSMGAVGDLQKFTQFQTAHAIREAASSPGSAAGQALGLGAGIALAQGLAGAMAGSMAPAHGHPHAPAPGHAHHAPQAPPAGPPCAKCQAPLAAGAAFCMSCGTKVGPATVPCVKCKAQIPQGSKFCASCGSAQKLACPGCGQDIAPGAKFCMGCGAKLA